jgi:DNA-directed RNA polymerase beta' subunit
MIDNNFKKNKQVFYKNSERVTGTTNILSVRIASPIKLRWLCTRKTSEGLTSGHIWNEITANHKTQKPFPGGIFCESIFGPLNRGICACKKTRWRNYPKTPKKLIRFKILHCLYCATQTIYWVKKLRTFSKFFPIEITENDVKHNLKKISCKCGRTKIHIFKFFSVVRTCRFCISSTKKPTHKKTFNS